MHARLSVLVEDLEQKARHLALATPGVDERVASQLDLAAGAAAARGGPRAAAELCDLAARLSPASAQRALRVLASARTTIAPAASGWLRIGRGRRSVSPPSPACAHGRSPYSGPWPATRRASNPRPPCTAARYASPPSVSCARTCTRSWLGSGSWERTPGAPSGTHERCCGSPTGSIRGRGGCRSDPVPRARRSRSTGSDRLPEPCAKQRRSERAALGLVRDRPGGARRCGAAVGGRAEAGAIPARGHAARRGRICRPLEEIHALAYLSALETISAGPPEGESWHSATSSWRAPLTRTLSGQGRCGRWPAPPAGSGAPMKRGMPPGRGWSWRSAPATACT